MSTGSQECKHADEGQVYGGSEESGWEIRGAQYRKSVVMRYQ